MAYFYRGNSLVLQSGGRPFRLEDLAKKYGTPLYVYDLDDVVRRVEWLKSGFSQDVQLHFAVKSNNHPVILKKLAALGCGADVVSVGEMQLALECGIRPQNIVFSGVAKSKDEITAAIQASIGQINVESISELRRIIQLARQLKKSICVALRFNPDVNPETHPYIKTGLKENKFGIDRSEISEFTKLLHQSTDCIEFVGLSIHIGSQLRSLDVLLEAAQKCINLSEELERDGFKLSRIDFGGGLGIDYNQFINEYAEDSSEVGLSRGELSEQHFMYQYGVELSKICAEKKYRILLEPGRILVARCGVLLSEVQYLKENPYKKFAILNTGMHHLMRPALYQAFHRILSCVKSEDTSGKDGDIFDVVGPICESSDVMGRDRLFYGLAEGQILAIMDAGAYGMSMANNYNMHALPRQVVFEQGQMVDFS